MNKKTKSLLSKIEHQISDASVRFELLLSIYGSEDNLKIINHVAPNVFLMIHRSLIESVVMGINRLCDPEVYGRKNKNLSLKRLRLSLPQKSKENSALQHDLIALEKKINNKVRKLNKIRSKRIAHNDYETHARNWYKKIPNSAIDSSLKMMEEFINKIYLHFDNCSVHILNPPYPPGDGPDRFMRLLGELTQRQQTTASNRG